MPLPFFCAVCDKPITPSRTRKHSLIHDKCIEKYLEDFKVTAAEEYKKSTTTTIKDKE